MIKPNNGIQGRTTEFFCDNEKQRAPIPCFNT